jgi:hypothetical protein
MLVVPWPGYLALRGRYNLGMARGWESKSVEDQILEKETANGRNHHENPASSQGINREKQRSLELARTRTLNDLESAKDPGYRQLLQRTLDYLDAELAKLQKDSSLPSL